MTKKLPLIILATALCACTQPSPPACAPGAVQECACGGGLPAGTQTCSDDGTRWGACTCKEPAAPAPPEPAIDETPIKVDADGRIILPAPRKDRGLPLMKALSLRRSTRKYSDRPLGLQTLSDLLWAATGINRPGEGKMTAPTAVNYQEIDIYVFVEQGVYLYDKKMHQLTPVLEGNHGHETGGQPFVKDAPLNLVYVSDTSRMGDMNEDSLNFYSATDTGFVSQNVYLFCASEGLGTVVRGMANRDELPGIIGLRPEQKVVLAQSVGYPAQ
jgi:nitroreductase